MVLRKGQHLLNEIGKLYEVQIKFAFNGEPIPYANVHKIIYYMNDKDFDDIMDRWNK